MFLSFKSTVSLIFAGLLVVVLGIGCAPRISEEDLDRLNEAKMATEEAVEKLARLREERINLEEGADTDSEDTGEDAEGYEEAEEAEETGEAEETD